MGNLKLVRLVMVSVLSLVMVACAYFIQKAAVKEYKLSDFPEGNDLNKFQYDFIYMTQLLETGFPMVDDVFPKEKRNANTRLFI